MNMHVNSPKPDRSWSSQVATIKADCGVEGWLFEDHSLPIVTLSLMFAGGSTFDPADKSGTANQLAGLLTAGAGDLTSDAFQKALDDHAIRLSFGASHQGLGGSMSVLTDELPRAVELLRLALLEPRLEQSEIERVRDAHLSMVRMMQSQPDVVAEQLFLKTAFEGSPLALPPQGTLESLPAITHDDLTALQKQVITSKNVIVSLVGAITPQTAKQVIDTLFGDMDEGQAHIATQVEMKNVGLSVSQSMSVPQSSIILGRPTLKHDDPDYFASLVVNNCLGGVAFSSRLFKEVREKRGLCYGIGTRLDVSKNSALFLTNTATPSDKVSQTLDVIKEEFRKIAADGISEQELTAAKNWLVGSFGMNFDTTGSIAMLLTSMKLMDRELSWLKERNEKIEALSMQDVEKAIERVLGDQTFLVAMTGES